MKSNIHPLFEQILDAVRPVEAARIKAEKAMRKLKTINVEIKQIKTLKLCQKAIQKLKIPVKNS